MRVVRLIGLLLIRPHQVAAPAPTPDRRKTPATGSWLRGVDQQGPVTEEMSLGVQSRDDTPGGREDERARAHYLYGEVLQR